MDLGANQPSEPDVCDALLLRYCDDGVPALVAQYLVVVDRALVRVHVEGDKLVKAVHVSILAVKLIVRSSPGWFPLFRRICA